MFSFSVMAAKIFLPMCLGMIMLMSLLDLQLGQLY